MERGFGLINRVVALLVLAIIPRLQVMGPVHLLAVIKITIGIHELVGPFRCFAPFDFCIDRCGKGVLFCSIRGGRLAVDLVSVGTPKCF